MQASFEAGADIVELDVHPTTDGQFAVFHDSPVDCRTEGSRRRPRAQHGRSPEARPSSYGYTADGGKTSSLPAARPVACCPRSTRSCSASQSEPF
jgi:glycerophosphoryl diester phosphodiesterase